MNGVGCLFKYEKQLFHPIEVKQSQSQHAALLQERVGGGNGKLKAVIQYMFRCFRIEDPGINPLLKAVAEDKSEASAFTGNSARIPILSGNWNA